MQETDAVSCLLCLQADEYGAMIKIRVPRNSIPPATEKVICQRCAWAIAEAYAGEQGEEIGQSGIHTLAQSGDALDRVASSGAGDPERDSSLAERAIESLVEVDRPESEAAAGGRADAEKGRVDG